LSLYWIGWGRAEVVKELREAAGGMDYAAVGMALRRLDRKLPSVCPEQDAPTPVTHPRYPAGSLQVNRR
jgi:hypothetical protein